MRRKWPLVAAVVLVLAVAAGALSLWRRHASEAPPGPAAVEPATAAAASEVSLRGEIQAQQTVPVAAMVDGTIESVFADVGEPVYEGQLLAQIQNTGLAAEHEAAKAQVESAQASHDSLNSRLIAARLDASRARADASRARSKYESAEKDFLRQQHLYSEGATPRLAFEKSRKDLDLAKAEFVSLDELASRSSDRVSELSRELDEARLVLAEKKRELEQAGERLATGASYSPVDGMIVFRDAQAGRQVSAEATVLFRIAVNLALLQVVVEPKPPDMARIHRGQEATILVAEIPGQGIAGNVKEIRNNQVIVEFVSPNPAVKPGLSAQVLIKLT